MKKTFWIFFLLMLPATLFAQQSYPYLFVSKFPQGKGIAITDTSLISRFKQLLDTSAGVRRMAKPQLVLLIAESAIQNRSLGFFCRTETGNCSLLTDLTKISAPESIIEPMLAASQKINAGKTDCSFSFYALKSKVDMSMLEKICQKAGCSIAVCSINPATQQRGVGIVMPDAARALCMGAFRRMLSPLRPDMFGKYYTVLVRL